MTFRPSAHGWGFDDVFIVEGPDLGIAAPPAYLGFGGGMCWAALDRYIDGRARPSVTTTPEPGTPLYNELRRRQVAALDGVWPRVREWQALPDGSWRDRLRVPLTPGRRDLASLSRREWTGIARSLRKQRPVLLTLIEPADGYARSTAARQVLACAYAREGSRIVVSIYDPARPGDDEARLAFSLRGPLDARLTGGRVVRGFFAVRYDRSPARPLGAETFADRKVLGLNRKVRGRAGATAGKHGLHVVARDGDGALLHFYRRSGKHWEGANVTEREELGSFELHSDPAPLAGPGGIGIHAFARSYVGDLLHFRSFRRWRVNNRTEHRRAGPRFRLEGAPVPIDLPWGGVCVVGRGKDGALVAYSYQPFRGWRAEEVPPAGGTAIEGDPAVVRIGPVVHVVARTRAGHVLHFERMRGGWSAGDLMTLCEGAEKVSGRPVLLVHEGRLHVLARGENGKLIHMAHDPEGEWKAREVARGATGDPALTAGPAGLHAFAVATGGGILHGWRGLDGKWQAEELVGTRSGLSGDAAPESGLVAWGTGEELRVLGRRGRKLVEWVWRSDSDWTASHLAERPGVRADHEPGEDPQLIRDAKGALHLFATDGTGTVVHMEAVAWSAPGERPAASAPAGGEDAAKPGKAGKVGKSESKVKPSKKGRKAKANGKLKATVRPTRPPREPEDDIPAEPLPLLADEDEEPVADLPLLDDAPEEEPIAELEPMDLAFLDPGSSEDAPGDGAPEEPAVVEASTDGASELPFDLTDPEEAVAPEDTAEPEDAAEAEDDDELFEWEKGPAPGSEAAHAPSSGSKNGKSNGAKNGTKPPLEPLDLDSLDSWPPTIPDDPKGAKATPVKRTAPGSSAKRERSAGATPPPWPDME